MVSNDEIVVTIINVLVVIGVHHIFIQIKRENYDYDEDYDLLDYNLDNVVDVW